MEPLKRASELMQQLLSECTGLNEFDRKLITYWTLATHALPALKEFPLLNLWGKSHTGKSTTMHIIKLFARNPLLVSLRGMTGAMIRDKFVAMREGTIIIEESDSAWKDFDSRFEQLLSDRFSRVTATESHKEQKESGKQLKWESRTCEYFGATVVHRRKPFLDIALDNRALTVAFSPVFSTELLEPPGATSISLAGVHLELPQVKKPIGIAGRVFTSYRSILALLEVIPDLEFEKQLLLRMQSDTENLKEAQQMEPDSLVLAALVAMIYDQQNGTFKFGNFRLADIAKLIEAENGREYSLNPRQIGKICRESLGFTTIRSHGQANVQVPHETAFLAVCTRNGYEDETITKRKKYIEGDSSTSSTRSIKPSLFSTDKPN